jgi:hypothetical protein
MTIEELKAHQKKSAESTNASLSTPVKAKDPRFWEPTIKDKDEKKSSAIIRPISCVPEEDCNVVVVTSHFIKRNNRNYSLTCPKTLGTAHKCPICEEYWSKPYGSRDLQLRPKKKWFMNIYVVDDRDNPENNGKVFLWACPKTIWDKIEAARNAEYAEERVENIFDMWSGANIVIRTKDKAGYMNYEDSLIRQSEALFKDLPENDPKYLEVASKAYPLAEFTDSKLVKSYNELAELLNEVDSQVDDRIDTAPGNYMKAKNLEEAEAEESDNFFAAESVKKEEVTTSDDDFFDDLGL